MNLRALLLPSAPPDSRPKLPDIVRNIAGGSMTELVVGTGLLALLSAAAYALQAPAWLALFVMLLVPVGVTCLALLAQQFFHPDQVGWLWTWLVLLSVLLLASLWAWVAYHQWNAYIGTRGLNAVQYVSSAVAFGLLTLALPLWNAHSRLRAVQLADLERAALAAQLKALQAQVEPHFLYNTLANARYLTRQDPQRATQMLDHLIAYLRSAMPDMRSDASTLGREFELAQHYLELMVMRFGPRLHFELEIADDLRLLPVPPLMLMTLVENAIRHGVEPYPGDVRVDVMAEVVGNFLWLQVRDDGAGLQVNVLGNGVGLRNVRERLAAQYGDQASFALLTLESGAIEAKLCLPLEVATKT